VDPTVALPEGRTPRVVAVVVTFNRLALLRRLMDRLTSLDHLAEILIVDNASTDGTTQWLATVTVAEPPRSAEPARSVELPLSVAPVETTPHRPVVRHRTLATNTGGAGGFHTGVEWAINRGADLLWLMDDDGVPEPDCLDTLLAYVGQFDFWGPAVLAEQDPERLCFPIRLPGSAQVVHDMSQVRAAAHDGLIPDVVIPFNGVLLSRELVQRIGLVREEFFIWGDDVEYLWRARAAGARVATVVKARFRHPATDDLGTPMMFRRTTYNHSPSDLKHYCMARNNLVNLRRYRGTTHALAFVAKTIWFYTFTRPMPGRLALSARAMWAGLRGDFTGHRRFLT
jgi:rhamnopyranosyl-N-acetylglucosaminyl-diphospho-decaprenol beta-1,3/1,4-galactofuranosyltransferase